MLRLLGATLALAFVVAPCALGQSSSAPTCNGTPLMGSVRDNTAAIIPGATVTLDGATQHTSAADGSFRFPCVSRGPHQITASYAGFASLTLNVSAPHTGALNLRLHAGEQVSVNVDADQQQLEPQAPGGANGLTLSGNQLQSLADDPDDLLRELQQLAAASGGSPGSTTISVDGFQGDSALPPKDSIAFINVTPDLFSAQYREPPFGGGRVEIYTKPGAKAFHGSFFATNSSSAFNANDPFTTASAGHIGKQRYGFDLSGPIRKQGSNFTVSLEHRTIDEVNVVNAITPGPNGSSVNTLYNVPAPQQLWEATARVDWQLNPKNIFSVSYQANISHISNVGVGGNVLQEAGYEQGLYDHTVHVSDVTTISDKLVHEFRLSVERRGETDVPSSTAPSVEVAGYFTGGGATIGNQRYRTVINELDDDIILTTKNHTIKAGVQGLLYFINDDQTINFNGNYIFGGVASGGTFLTPLQQYQQALAGGTATEFNNVTGTPVEQFAQARIAFFFEDNVKLNDKWSASYGLRYFFETNPANYNSIAPRGGLSYTPDKKKAWVLNAHFGIFNGQYTRGEATELHREDGVQRITSLIYNPVYNNPFAGATPIHALRTTAPGFNNGTYAIGEASVSRDLPFGFNINVQEVQLRFLIYARTVNINSPLNQDPYGPRPITPDLNILQLQNNGTGQGHGEFMGLSNFKQKRVQFFLGGLHLNIRDNTDDNIFFQPQSAYTDAGEQARRDNQGLWMLFGNATVALPYKASLSMNGFAQGGQPFNITTGTDNNGDGDFNDRPQYAAPGSVANGTTIFQTPLGLLTNAGAYANGVPLRPIARDLGALPWNFHLDANLERKFLLTRDPKGTHQQALTANIRSANFLNHTNVTAEGSVLGSPQFLVPIAADTARRIELGLRYSF